MKHKLIMENWRKFMVECGKPVCDTYDDEVEKRNKKQSKKARKEMGLSEEAKEEFKPHMMYDPKTGKGKKAEKYEDHVEMDKKGWVHEKPDIDEALTEEEGCWDGYSPGAQTGKKTKKGKDGKRVNNCEEITEEEKPCKPQKGKRYADRVDGKCRSYGQAGKEKDGTDRIEPGTDKGHAYCARSAKIKKCKEPPCANDLSRKKWKCQGDRSVP